MDCTRAPSVAAALAALLLVSCAPVARPGVVERSELALLISATPAGGVVTLAPGEHRLVGGLVIGASVHLRGAGSEVTRVVADRPLVFRGERVVLEGITFEGSGHDAATVVVEGTRDLIVLASRFEAPSGRQTRGEALRLVDVASGTIRHNHITGTFDGVVVASASRVSIEGNVFTGLPGVALHFADASRGLALANDIIENGFGILVSGSATPRLEANTVRGNRRSGVVYIESSGGVAWANAVVGNGNNGFEVRGDARPVLVGNVLRGNFEGAIEYAGRGAGWLRDTTCEENGTDIELWQFATPELVRNGCHVLDLRQRSS
ncbi:hypothetical protein BH23DEI1_BH23DEI1_21920 [soil metagenome]